MNIYLDNIHREIIKIIKIHKDTQRYTTALQIIIWNKYNLEQDRCKHCSVTQHRLIKVG